LWQPISHRSYSEADTFVRMGTTRGLERLIFFTDAVVAIAITLLILPIVDAVPEAAAENFTIQQFLSGHWPQLLTFLISFLVIARLWISHHAIFEHVANYSRGLVNLSLLWALTIVVLPLPTALTALDTAPLAVAFYVGTMTLSSMILSAITLTVRRNPALELADNPIEHHMVVASVSVSIEFIIALVIGVVVPQINYFALLVLLLGAPIQLAVSRVSARRRRSSSTT
jgi:uncharacterized membrane protein